jgi:hypothetical protein
MKMKNRNMRQEPARAHDLRALLVLSVVVGAYLGAWVFLLILQAI